MEIYINTLIDENAMLTEELSQQIDGKAPSNDRHNHILVVTDNSSIIDAITSSVRSDIFKCIQYTSKEYNSEVVRDRMSVATTEQESGTQGLCNRIVTTDADNSILITDINSIPCADIGLGERYRGKAPYVLYDAGDITAGLLRKIYCRKNDLPVTILETKRVCVREMTLDDFDQYYELYEQLRNCPYIKPLHERTEERKQVASYIEHMYRFFDYGLWLCFLKDSGELIGRIGIENCTVRGANVQQLGYMIAPRYQKQGLAYEVCSEVLRYARDVLGVGVIYACIEEGNIPSRRLALKLGFKRI